jgi:hypothetical protein
MADQDEVATPEILLKLDAKVHHGKMPVPDALEAAYKAGEAAGLERAAQLVNERTVGWAGRGLLVAEVRALSSHPATQRCPSCGSENYAISLRPYCPNDWHQKPPRAHWNAIEPAPEPRKSEK